MTGLLYLAVAIAAVVAVSLTLEAIGVPLVGQICANAVVAFLFGRYVY